MPGQCCGGSSHDATKAQDVDFIRDLHPLISGILGLALALRFESARPVLVAVKV